MKFWKRFEVLQLAITFAESGEFETARGVMGKEKDGDRKEKKPTPRKFSLRPALHRG